MRKGCISTRVLAAVLYAPDGVGPYNVSDLGVISATGNVQLFTAPLRFQYFPERTRASEPTQRKREPTRNERDTQHDMNAAAHDVNGEQRNVNADGRTLKVEGCNTNVIAGSLEDSPVENV